MVLAVKQTENETQVFQKTNKELELGPWKLSFSNWSFSLVLLFLWCWTTKWYQRVLIKVLSASCSRWPSNKWFQKESSLTVWCSYFPVDQPYSGRSLGLNCTSFLNPDDLSGQSPLPQLLFASVEKVVEIRFKMVLKDRSSYSQGSRTSRINSRRWITHCRSPDRQKVCSAITFYDAYD